MARSVRHFQSPSAEGSGLTRRAGVGANGVEHFFDVATTASNNESFRVLILEDDQISLASASQTILRAVPGAVIESARTLKEGRRLLEDRKFHLCVLDIQLPDGLGIDFLHDIQLRNPEACVAILTGVPLPHYRDQAEAFGILHFMEKPADARALGVLVREQWEKWSGSKSGGSCGGFSAMLTQLTTLDIIQLKCLARSTVTLDFVGEEGRRGRVYFKDGEIVHAKAGAVKGVEAFNEIVGWRSGQVTEVNGAQIPMRTIEGHWQGLLMHAVHWVDEHKQG